MSLNIIELSCVEFLQYNVELYTEILNLFKKCGWDYSQNYCIDDYRIIFLYENTEIVSVLLTVKYGKITEIYSVCTEPLKRGFGYAKKLLLYLINKTPGDEYLWLGIKLTNTSFEQALGLYSSLGFQNPYLTKNSGAKMDSLSFTCLGLYYIPNTPFDKEIVIAKSKKLLSEYKKELNVSSINFIVIDIDLCNTWKNLLDQNNFIEGYLTYYGNTVSLLNQPVINITYSPNNTQTNFGYQINNKIIPDSSDMLILFNKNLVKYFLITIFGVFTIQLTIECYNFNITPDMNKGIVEVFNNNLSLNLDNQLLISNFLHLSNSINMNKILLNSNINNDFRLFNVNFYGWNDIIKNNGIGECMLYKPIIIMQNTNSIRVLSYNRIIECE